MQGIDWRAVEEELKASLSEKRFRHSKGTAEMARKLAEAHGVDGEKAYRAGLLHDCCREWSKERLLEEGRRLGLLQEPMDEALPGLLHGPVGAWYIQDRWGVDDTEIAWAVASHTLGRPAMGDLEKIVYLADKLEPSRSYEGVEELRQQAFADLNRAMLQSLDQTAAYVKKRKQGLHPKSAMAREYLKQLIEKQEASEP